MKKIISLLLILSLLTVSVPAASPDPVTIVQALGIMTGNERGELNLNRNVTRAEFCKMLVAASACKDTTGGVSNYALFKDVDSGHWATAYIKVCMDNGWFQGYLDGTFRPNNPITLEEAATVSLRLLGYTKSDLSGAYPAAQLARFQSLGLHEGFSTGQGQNMTRSDCAQLFANLMEARTREGAVYGAALGLAMDASGHLDYASLVANNTKGPFILADGNLEDILPFSLQNAVIYRNGSAAPAADAGPYDVCYYNAGLRVVWLYSNRITGSYTAASPSLMAPSSVTVSGVTYPIETSEAAYQLSTQGPYSIGDKVTLLLGMNGGVAGVCDVSSVTGIFYGVVKSIANEALDNGGKVTVSKTVSVACTDGVERRFQADSAAFPAGTLVQVDYSAEKPITRLPACSLSGRFTESGFGGFSLASDVEILDTDRSGAVRRIYPSRLNDSSLRKENVLYYTLNAKNEITRLILRDATGDAAGYGLVMNIREESNPLTSKISSSYRCLIDGKETTVAFQDRILPVKTGAVQLVYSTDGQISSMRNLKQLSISTLRERNALVDNKHYTVADDVCVYIRRDGVYTSVPLDTVFEGYRLTGYADNFNYPAGNMIRIIVAIR